MVFPCKSIRLGFVKKVSHTSFSTGTASASTRRASSLAGGRSTSRLLRLALRTCLTERLANEFYGHTVVDWRQTMEGEIAKQHAVSICEQRVSIVEREEGLVVTLASRIILARRVQRVLHVIT